MGENMALAAACSCKINNIKRCRQFVVSTSCSVVDAINPRPLRLDAYFIRIWHNKFLLTVSIVNVKYRGINLINFGVARDCWLVVEYDEFILQRASMCIVHYSYLHFSIYLSAIASRRSTLSGACGK